MSGVPAGRRLKSLLADDKNAARLSESVAQEPEVRAGSGLVHCGVFLRLRMEDAFARYGEFVAVVRFAVGLQLFLFCC